MFLDIACGELTVPEYLVYVISLVYFSIRIIIPILLIIFCMIDMGKAIVAKKEEDVKKAQSLLLKKLLIGLVIFILPYFIEWMIRILSQDSTISDCIKNLIDYRTNLFGK